MPLITLLACLLLSLLQAQPAWETTEFIWNGGIIGECDKGFNPNPYFFFRNPDGSFNQQVYRHIRSGDVVWVLTKDVKRFYKKILPTIKHPFVLVICGDDRSFPSDCGFKPSQWGRFLSHPNIIHIFAQNCDYTDPKITYLPIGLDFHSMAYKGITYGERSCSPQQQECRLKSILEELNPTYFRRLRAFVDFQHSDTLTRFQSSSGILENRTVIFQRLLCTGMIEYAERMPRSKLWQTKGDYAFSISPHGNGLDCHRTWEDLILGCIVIVKTSPLDPLYQGLPVVIIQDWCEVTEENMCLWKDQFYDAFTNPCYRDKLTHKYWMDQIRAYAAPYKQQKKKNTH